MKKFFFCIVKTAFAIFSNMSRMLLLTSLILGFLCCFIPNSSADIGPIVINESNNPLILPSGQQYATVTLQSCQCESTVGVEMVVDVNETLLPPNPTGSYGVQKFGFNYKGSSTLSFILPQLWYVGTNATLSSFGKFRYSVYNTGTKRQDPLTFKICSNTNLNLTDFVVKNSRKYTFAAHIANFVKQGALLTSSFFGTKHTDPLTTTTTSIMHTTTTTAQQTTTTTIIPTTTTTTPETTSTTSLVTTTVPVINTTPPTLIELSIFIAIPGSREVVLVWNTESDIENEGFNIYRSEAEDGEYLQINESLIPAQGSPAEGALYRYLDQDVKNRTTYYYKLEDIDLYGNSTMHGPINTVPRWMYGISR